MSEVNGKTVNTEPELYRRFRPKKLADVVGQPEAVKVLSGFFKSGQFPHAVLFHGPSGCGKSTLAYIVKDKLNCGRADFEKINCASCDPLETVRGIEQRMRISPLEGKTRVWLMEEFQALSRAGFAQQAMLDMLEFTPAHCYFLLCTTDPGKIIKAIQTRCTPVPLKGMSPENIREVLRKFWEKYDGKAPSTTRDVGEKIVEMADGSARTALVLLGKVLDLGSEEERLEALEKADTSKQGIDLARKLMDGRSKWKDIAPILKGLEDDPETVRRIILGYAAAVLMNGAENQRAGLLLEVFRTPNWDSGKPGLVGQCFEVYKEK